MPNDPTAPDPSWITTLRSTATVKAAQLTDDADWEAIAAWCGGTLHTDDSAGAVGCEPTPVIRVPASAGDGYEEAHEGDWVIAMTYEGDDEPTYEVVLSWNVGPESHDGEAMWWVPADAPDVDEARAAARELLGSWLDKCCALHSEHSSDIRKGCARSVHNAKVMADRMGIEWGWDLVPAWARDMLEDEQ